ncbi:MAG TPA: hypothetical protein VGE72_09750 [Azospirillum sp.]
MAVQMFHPDPVDQSVTNWSVASRLVGAFAPHAQVMPDMTVALDAGHLLNGSVLTEVAAQSTGTITAPTGNPRIDRIVVNGLTGASAVITGIESATPVPPPIPPGTLPVARVGLTTTTTAIANAAIVDERAMFGLSNAASSAVLCRATLNGANQSFSGSTLTTIAFSATDFNFGNAFDTTNHRFQPSIAGYYDIKAALTYYNVGSTASCHAKLMKGGSVELFSMHSWAVLNASSVSVLLNDIVYLNGSTDYLTVVGYYDGSLSSYVHGASTRTFFSANLLRV